jgi:diaminopimelate epimerase
MSGAGNDFLMIHNPAAGLDLKRLAVKACDRTRGVGADGIITVEKSKKKTCDYKMRIINADGSEAEMCGNGARCFAAYVARNLKPEKTLFSFETMAGEILGRADGEKAVVRLSDPKDCEPNIPLLVNGRELHVSYIDTGVPHAVVFVHDIAGIDVKNIGQAIRFHKTFEPRGTNVNFVEPLEPDLVAVRTYERGVEDETRACGTGTVAAALLGYRAARPGVKNVKSARMKVRTFGGEILEVTFGIVENVITNVWLKGSARFVCEGKYYFK